MYQEARSQLAAIVDALRHGESRQETVRTVLSWFNAQRRGYWILRDIKNLFHELGLTTKESFEGQFIDGTVTFELLEENKPTTEVTEDKKNATLADEVTEQATDPTFRLGRLDAANGAPVFANPDDSIQKAATLMLEHDYSQLPVMRNDRDVKGILRLNTLALRSIIGQLPRVVRECMEPHVELSADANLFEAIDYVTRHGYVLVRSSDNRISGIVTSSDLNIVLKTLGEPFLLLGEVENFLRRIVGAHLSKEEIAASRDPNDRREVEGVADLSFGEYVRILQHPDYWTRIALALDKQVFITTLDNVRHIRNDVMHFDPDGVAPDQLDQLRRTALMLRTLQSFAVI